MNSLLKLWLGGLACTGLWQEAKMCNVLALDQGCMGLGVSPSLALDIRQ